MQRANAIAHIMFKPWETALVFLILFFLFSVFFFLIDFVPEPITAAPTATHATQTAPTVTVSQVTSRAHVSNVNLIAGPAPAVTDTHTGELPTRVVIAKVGIDTPISNPSSASLTTLDNALLSGAVHYPGTAYLGEVGSVLLFGHQSYLPVIHNQAFKAFNNVQKLSAGDIVSVYAGSTEYRYAVRSVTLVTVEFGNIPLETTGATLTLVTCNSLGEKEERYIVKADFIGVYKS